MSDRTLGPPVIEPLSDLAWARIERGLWSRLDQDAPEPVRRSSPKLRWIAGGVVAAAAAVLVVLAIGRDPAPELAAHEPASPTRMVSGASPSDLTYGDAHVTLEPQSALVMTRDPAVTTAVLERGAAWFTIAEREQPFVVMAGDVMVRVVGTRFRVARSADHANVEVERGIVEVRYRGSEHRLVAGQRWSSDESTAAVLDRPPPPAPSDPPPAIPDPPANDPPPTNDPLPTTRPARTKTTTKPRTQPTPPATPTADTRRADFVRLSALEARDPAAAIAGYLELAKGSDRWAELALFAAGRLASDRRDPRAKALLESYLQRFPRGANADDARELVKR